MKKNDIILTGIVIILFINSIAVLLIGLNTFEDEVETLEVIELENYTIDDCLDLVWEISEKRDECIYEGLDKIWGIGPVDNDNIDPSNPSFEPGMGCIRDTKRELCMFGGVSGVVTFLEDSCSEPFPYPSEVWAKCLERI